MSKFSSFIEGYGLGQRMVRDFDEGQTKKKLSEAAQAQPEVSQNYTAEDGRQLEAIATARDEQGNPYYMVGTDAGGGYTVTPNFKAEGQTAEPAPINMAKSGVTTSFMGKDQAGAMTPEQVDSARSKAMADIVMQNNPVLGRQMLREDKRFGWEGSRADREERTAKKAEDFESMQRAEYGNTFMSKNIAAYAPQAQAYQAAKKDYDARLQSGIPPEQIGLAPQTPKPPVYTPGQALADQGRMLALKMQYGKADPSELEKFAAANRKVADEGYSKALRLAQSGASLANVAEQFAQSGDMRFDPASVVADKMVNGADGMPSRVIEFKGTDGKVQSINVMAELDALGQADGYFNRFFKGEGNRRGNEAGARADKKLAQDGAEIAGKAADRHLKQTEAVKKATAGLALFDEQNPNASKAMRDAAAAGVIHVVPKAGGYKTESGDVTTLLGTPAVDKYDKPITDYMTGRQMVNRNKEREQAFWKFMQANGIRDTNEGLQRFLQSPEGSGAKSAGPKKLENVTDADVKATAKKYGISEDEVRKKLQMK